MYKSPVDTHKSATKISKKTKRTIPADKTKQKENKRKKEKDPLEPKKPLSSFLIFSAKRRLVLQETNPNIFGADLSKELGRLWGELSESDKRPFIEQATILKHEYNEAKKGMHNVVYHVP